MHKRIFTSIAATLLFVSMSAQVSPGDNAIDFTLQNVDGASVSLSDYADAKGVILVFTCNPCPFSKAYEQRIIRLHKTFSKIGYPVIAINPNDTGVSPDDSMDEMKKRASEKNYPFPYLKDESGIYKKYGATRTPHVFLLQNRERGKFSVAYIGAIDNNAMDEKAVTEKYVENAIRALESGTKPAPSTVKAIGCTIKTRS